ncbi:MAG: hypothetical protein ACO32I_08030 [Candidatus Limnocylindrus sp.]
MGPDGGSLELNSGRVKNHTQHMDAARAFREIGPVATIRVADVIGEVSKLGFGKRLRRHEGRASA